MNCAICRHSHGEGAPEGMLFCRRFPPTSTPVLMGVQQTISGPAPVIQAIPTRPVVNVADTCGEFDLQKAAN